MDKSYSPRDIESRLYERWESNGWFAPAGDGAPYCIMIPPPNVTGTLHMGHAFQHTLMDALTRLHRMDGDRTLWQPGTDHAGIATQMVVERQLEAEGRSRHDLGRDAFGTKQPIIATIEVVGTGTLSTIGDVNFNSKFKFDYSKLTGTEFVTTYTDKSGNTIELGGTAQGAPTATPTVLAIKVTEPITRGTGRFARIIGKGTSDILLNAVTLGGEFTVNWVVTF